MFTQYIKRWFFSIKNKAIEIETLYQINNKVVKFTHRWLFSTNHKDIDILYLIFSGRAGFCYHTLEIALCAYITQKKKNKNEYSIYNCNNLY